MATTTPAFHREQKATARPIWLEALAGIDFIALHAAPVYYGLGVPHGNQSAVIVVPGFLGTDHYLTVMYYWLRRIGYKPYFSGIGWNADCLNTLTQRLSHTINRAYNETDGKKVHLIGHSLGGILSRAAATHHKDKVASVITLGSPYRGVSSHPVVLQTAEAVRAKIMSNRLKRDNFPNCYTGYCDCHTLTALQSGFPDSIQQSSIYTKTDGIVDWRVCVNDDPATDFEVKATHVGLAFNPAAYYLIAKRLSKAIE